MKKLLFIAMCVTAAFYGCDDDKKDTPAAAGSGSSMSKFMGDSFSVKSLSGSVAKDMIKHYKSDSVAPNRGKLFRGGVDVSRLDSIISGASRFYIFAAAYLGNYPDSSKRNMPTFVLQVMRAGSGAEETTLYYAVDSDKLCPPPPDCNTVIESSE
jgi:hypothetical protein